MKVLILFAVATAINVILSTVKSILTIKAGKTVAALANAITYGFYTWVIILTNVDGISLWVKMGITAICNFVGVFIVKLIEEKARKDKMWLVKMTIPNKHAEQAKNLLTESNISFTYYDLTKYFVFDTFCETQKETSKVMNVCSICEGKAFATENKLSL